MKRLAQILFTVLCGIALAQAGLNLSGTVSLSGALQVLGDALGVPSQAINFLPADGATRVAKDPTISWDNGGGATSYDVFFGTASPPTSIGNQTGTTYAASAAYSGTFYYRISSKNGSGTTTGAIKSFTTVTPYAVTSLVDFENGTIGAVPSGTNLTNGTRGAAGTWSISTAAATYAEFVAASATLYTPATISGTAYTGTGSRGCRYRMDQTENYHKNVLAADVDNFSFSCDFSFGANGNFQTVDFINIGTTLGGFAVLQMGANGAMHAHWGNAGSGSAVSSDFTLSTNTTYRIEMILIRHSDVSVLNVYQGATLIATRNFLLSSDYDSPFHQILIGRTDAHTGGNPPSTSWATYDNITWSTTGVNPLAP